MAQTAQVNININATAANKSVQDLSNSINQAGGSSASLRLELKKITQELQLLEPGSARFQELSNRAGQLRDQIADTSATINAVAGNAIERFTAGLTNTIQIGVAGFQALNAAQVLFGSENEEVNKSIQKMTALLNLSQALQTLGGLDQKIVEIRASFASLIPVQQATAASTAAAAVSLEGEAIAATAAAGATEAAAVSTTALGRAMSALPLVGIIAALGFAVKALVDYASSNEEAEKKEEDRKKKLEELKKAQEAHNKAVVASSKDYVSLIFALKQTNAGTIERKKLIDEVNKTYGTTFKNLKDETAFQSQLNLSIKEYIALQALRIREEINKEKLTEAVRKQMKAEGELYKARRDQEKQAEESNQTLKEVYDNFDTIRLAIDKAQRSYNNATYEVERYSTSTATLNKKINELTDNNKKYVTSTNDVKTSTKDTADAVKTYEEILNQIVGVQENNRKQEDEIFKKRSENFDKTIDLVEFDRKRAEEEAIKKYETIKTQIEKELTQEKIKAEEKQRLLELIKLNEEALTNAIKVENEKRILDNQIATAKILEENQKRFKYLKDEEKALQTEIRFGDGNTTDTKLALLNREAQAYVKNIDSKLLTSKYGNRVELDEFENLQRSRLELLNQYAVREAEERKQIAETEFQKILDTEKTRIEERKDLSVEYYTNEKGQIEALVTVADEATQKLIDLTDEERKAKIDSLEEQIKKAEGTKKTELELELQNFSSSLIIADDLADARTQTQENLNTTIVNLNDEKNTKILEADTELNEKLKENTIKTEDEILDEKIKRLDSYFAYAQEAFQQASSLISQFAKQQQEIRTTQLEDAIAMDQERIESQYAAGLISREQYDNALEQIDQKQQQAQLQIDRKNFRTEKALSIAGATIDGARAVLGAFAGTQGGIVVRTIAAALAGVFAATQIALIARQEFKAADGGIVPGDGSGEIDSVPSRLAPGEAVINARSTQAFLPLLSAINEVNGGQSFVPDLPANNAPQRFAPIFVDNQNKEPIRAYVVESDITDAQKRIARIERSTRF